MIGVVLAGGRATRLGGGNKGSQLVAGRPISDRVVAALRPQCDRLVINANGDAFWADLPGVVVVPDTLPDQPGPLAGVLAGLEYAAAAMPGAHFMVTAPIDTPFLPIDLVARLQDARLADIVCARSAGRPHFTIALWSVDLRHDLRKALDEGVRAVHAFVERHPFAYADWPATPFDPFFNVNTPEDLAEAERIAETRDQVEAFGTPAPPARTTRPS